MQEPFFKVGINRTTMFFILEVFFSVFVFSAREAGSFPTKEFASYLAELVAGHPPPHPSLKQVEARERQQEATSPRDT